MADTVALLVLMGISGFALMCSIPRWIHLHGWKYRAGIKMSWEVFDASFWISAVSFFSLAVSVIILNMH